MKEQLHARNVQLALLAIPRIMLENLLALLVCTHLKVNPPANHALQVLCARTPQVLESLSALMVLFQQWAKNHVYLAQKVSSVLLRTKL
jgi:hypothetical protein